VFFSGNHAAIQAFGFNLPSNGGSDVRVQENGLYHISYSLLTSRAIGAKISLLINGVSVPSTRDILTRDDGRVFGLATLLLKVNDVVSIGVEDQPITLRAAEDNAVLDIFKIADVQ
jgi:hypothetical protein